MNKHGLKVIPLGAYLWIVLFLMLLMTGVGFAQNRPGFIHMVQEMEDKKTGLSSPAGVVFSSRANAFHVIETRGKDGAFSGVTVIKDISVFGHGAGSTQIKIGIENPLNVAMDNKYGRLLIYQATTQQLIEVSEDSTGVLDANTLTIYDVSYFGLQDPQGMTFDPIQGYLYFLDGVGPRLVRIMLPPDGSFTSVKVDAVNLSWAGNIGLRGIAFDPTTGDFHVVSLGEQQLYEFTNSGEMVAVRDLAEFNLSNSQGIIFAPSGDQTDNPMQLSLYLADCGLPVRPQSDILSNDSVGNASTSGKIVELSLIQPLAQVNANFTSALVRTTNMAAFSPPSPDPSGLTYLSSSNTLLMSDGEVEEKVSGITHFMGANLWEITLDGTIVRTANISSVPPTFVPMSDEPTGVTWNPGNGHYYFSDDNRGRVFDLNPGVDGLYGTADDSWTYFSTLGVGNGDPEGIAFDIWNNKLFVVDGVNQEIYQYTLAGSLVGQFDVQVNGVSDPESVEFNPISGTLFILGSNRVIIETTTSGSLLQTISVSASSARAPAGLAYAPASDGSGIKHFYIVDRGIDNNIDPNIIDGKMYEMTAPIPNTPTPTNTFTSTASQTATVTPLSTNTFTPTPTRTATATPLSTNTFTPTPSRTATVTPLSTNTVTPTQTYIPSNTPLATNTLTATPTTTPGGLTILDVRVSARSDDAEESAAGKVKTTSPDLQLVLAGNLQTVGMRFNSVSIPKNAQISNAYIQFQADALNSGVTSLTIRGEAQDNPGTFLGTNLNISSRLRTSASTGWSPSPWTVLDQAGVNQRTTNISAVIQEIVNRPGWSAGNSLVIIITGTGVRTARAYDSLPSGAPLLHVEYIVPNNNTPTPTISFTPSVTPTMTPSSTLISTPLPTNTVTPTPRQTETVSPLPTNTLTPTPSQTATITPLPTNTFTPIPSNTSTATPLPTATATLFENAPVLAGAGDIECSNYTGIMATSLLLDNITGSVFTAGDNGQLEGGISEYTDCYDPTWGRHKARTHPVPGNHDYNTSDASAYYAYFGTAAGEPGKGYYSYDLGSWHIIALNSQINVSAGSLQEQWLRADLATHSNICTLAYWHQPRFSSGTGHGSNSAMGALWQALYDYGADVVINGHEHMYERFAAQNPAGVAEPSRGIREFVVGTGGDYVGYPFGTPLPNSEVINNRTYGVIKFTLNATSYDWEFIPIAGETFTDSGSSPCVGVLPLNTVTPTQTSTATSTPTKTPLLTNTPTSTSTNAPLPTNTSTPTLTPSKTPTNTPSPTNTLTSTPGYTPTSTSSPTRTSTSTRTNTPSPTNTSTPTLTPSNTPTNTAQPTNTLTSTPSNTPTRTTLPTNTFTPTPSLTPTNTALATNTPTPTQSPTPVGPTILNVRVSASSDDAEENAAGTVKTGSPDLQLVQATTLQTVGMRFNNITIPKNAQIVNAYIQFQADALNSGATSLTIRGEAQDNPGTFLGSNLNISSRFRTSASTGWSPSPWTVLDQAGADQRTSNISAVIQEIVNRPGWSAGNSLVIIITGTGVRTAKAYDGLSTGAPLLHVEYLVP